MTKAHLDLFLKTSSKSDELMPGAWTITSAWINPAFCSLCPWLPLPPMSLPPAIPPPVTSSGWWSKVDQKLPQGQLSPRNRECWRLSPIVSGRIGPGCGELVDRLVEMNGVGGFDVGGNRRSWWNFSNLDPKPHFCETAIKQPVFLSSFWFKYG